MTDESSELLHRLNGQLLSNLQQLLSNELERLGSAWNAAHWIINVIMLHRSVDAEHSAKLFTSATLHRGRLVVTPEDYDDETVAVLGLPVPLDASFSGHAAVTSDVVWINNLGELEGLSGETVERPQLARLYREFGHVGVSTPAERPVAEFVFPILIQVGLAHLVLGVVNMEFFDTDGTVACPFTADNQIIVSDAVTEFLNVHGFYLLIGQPQLAGDVPSAIMNRRRTIESDAGLQQRLLSLHDDVLASYVAQQ